jgi:hypothetical protein
MFRPFRAKRNEIDNLDFTIVEVHCPNREMHQFGLHQHIPDDVDTLDDLHDVNHRGK